MLRWARPNRALFSTFFHFFVKTCPKLALFDPLFAPYACRCDDASVDVFSLLRPAGFADFVALPEPMGVYHVLLGRKGIATAK